MILDIEKCQNKDLDQFIPIKEWLIIFAFAAIGLFINIIPYSRYLSIFIQVLLMGGIILLFRNKPVMIFVAIIFLSILPSRLYGGLFADDLSSFYTINSKVALIGVLILFAYPQIFLHDKLRLTLIVPLLLFVIIISYFFAFSRTYFTFDFLWIILAYILLPNFIKSDQDARTILISFVISILLFCISITPLLIDEDLYRGSVNLNPNYASLFIVMGLICIFIILNHYKNVSIFLKSFLYFTVIISLIIITFFASRTGFIIVFLLILFHLIFNLRNTKSFLFIILFLLVVFFVMYVYGLFDSILGRFFDDSLESAGGRFVIQFELLKFFYSSNIFRFFFGYGHLTASYFGLHSQAHNSYLSILIGLGIFGLLIYLYYVFSISISLFKNRNYVYLFALLILLIYSMAIEPYIVEEGVLLFCLLDGVALLYKRKIRVY